MGQSPFWVNYENESDEDAWGTCALGEVWLPGIAVVKVGKIERDIDKKKAKGKSGGTMTDNGYKPATVTIKLKLWTKEHHDWWLRILPKINPRREGATKDPFEVRHPGVMELGLGPMFVSAIDPGDPPSAKSGRTIIIYCEEWFDKPKAVKKGTGKPKSAATASPEVRAMTGDLLGMSMAPGQVSEPSDPDAIMSKVPKDSLFY